MNELRILLADDDEIFCRLVCDLLKRHGYRVESVNTVPETQAILQEKTFDILLQDLCFPELRHGFGVLREVKANYPHIEVMMISGLGNTADVVQAISNGAADFIVKPLEPEYLLLRMEMMSERVLQQQQVRLLERSAIGMVGKTPAMQTVFEKISAAARHDSPVLILGETGVGKELAARAIHRLSAYGDKDMININSAAIPRRILELASSNETTSEMYGQVLRDYFVTTRGTSIFLDEISEMPFMVQTVLARILIRGGIGAGQEPPVGENTRIISASHEDVRDKVRQGLFDEDLFYRLSTILIEIPPLRDRAEDIPLLAQHFINIICQRHKTMPRRLSLRAQVWLSEQKWEGNVRELRNAILRAVSLSSQEILDIEDFSGNKPLIPDIAEGYGLLKTKLRRYEAHLIRLYLQECNFNTTQTARLLGVDKSNLSKRIKMLGIQTDSESVEMDLQGTDTGELIQPSFPDALAE